MAAADPVCSGEVKSGRCVDPSEERLEPTAGAVERVVGDVEFLEPIESAQGRDVNTR
jgi:hypothetical protein